MVDKDQFELSKVPFDSISTVRFSPKNPSHLIVSSWDTTVRFYDVDANDEKSKYDHRAAVLDCCFGNPDRAYSGCLDQCVREFDLQTETTRVLGQHDAPVSRTSYAQGLGSLITGSWDCTLRFWDSRASRAQQAQYTVPERVYNMDITGNILVVAMASRRFHIYDVRKMESAAQERESSLKFLTRAVGCMATGEGYATGSVEGRISVEYFDAGDAAQSQKYAFKCHRQTVNGEDHVWPVNCIAFHPVYNTFASAGSDGTVSVWDHKSKKRLRQYPRYHSAVNSAAFNCDGTKLAVGVSYNWDEGTDGAKGAPMPSVYIRGIGDEVKPKGWSG